MTTAVVRALFTVTAVKRHTYGNGMEITLSATYDQQIPEQMRYAEATPSGELTMYVDNKKAVERLIPNGELGKRFYLDFVPAD